MIPITAELDYDTEDDGHVKLDNVPPFSVGKVNRKNLSCVEWNVSELTFSRFVPE